MGSGMASLFARAIARERRPLILLSFLILIGAIFVGTFAPPDPVLNEELERLLEEVQKGGYAMVFLNNAMIAMTFFVPLLGLGSAFMTSYTTGAAMSVVASTAGANAQALFVTMMLMPHSWMEFLAYSLALTENVVLLQKLVSKKGLENELGPFLASVVLALALLALGTLTELITINIISGALA